MKSSSIPAPPRAALNFNFSDGNDVTSAPLGERATKIELVLTLGEK